MSVISWTDSVPPRTKDSQSLSTCFPTSTKTVFEERLAEHHLTQVLVNMPPGNWAKGERGIARRHQVPD
jgi:hydroxypyruvate isomerase